MNESFFVIEAVDAEGRVVDVHTCDESDGVTIIHPPKFHFVDGVVSPFHSSGFATIEVAQSKMQEAVDVWASADYAKWVGQVSHARIVPLNPDGHPGGYKITGTSDEEVAGHWYLLWRDAFHAYMKLLRKKVKHRGETPQIIFADGIFTDGEKKSEKI